jgi:hypothetical protein
MVFGLIGWIITAFHFEPVHLSASHSDFRNEISIDVPSNTPGDFTCDTMWIVRDVVE